MPGMSPGQRFGSQQLCLEFHDIKINVLKKDIKMTIKKILRSSLFRGPVIYSMDATILSHSRGQKPGCHCNPHIKRHVIPMTVTCLLLHMEAAQGRE